MKMLSKLMSAAFLIGSSLAVFTACSSDDIAGPTTQQAQNGHHTVTMKLVGGCEGFDGSKTRADESAAISWNDGDKLYLQFTNGSNIVSGNATYSATSKAWTLEYYGTLALEKQSKCQAFYFDSPVSVTSTTIKLNDRTGIYEDASGTYLFDGSNLTVNASLKPKTSRLRFKGTEGTPIIVEGISHYTSYDIASNSFFTSSEGVKDTIYAESGYTPYIYGYFTDAKNPRIRMVVNSGEGYTMECASTMFNVGESGYLTIPTETSHNGWATGLNFTVKGVSFKMIPVAYKEGDFLIGETEVTEGLYNAVMENEESTKSKYPAASISYSEFKTFIVKLNTLTGLAFRIPSADEWKYAFKGGKKSMGYTYSGSNNPDDVAWYSVNSDNKVHEVKQKHPNELGIYDMSGNVEEWVEDSYSYSYGGNYTTDNDAYLQSTNSNYNGGSAGNVCGIRLALTLK